MSKASKRLRRVAASAKTSRVTELSILALGATLLAPYAIAQDAAASKEQGDQTTTKSDDDLTEILVTGIRKAFATSQEIKKEADTVVDSITASDIGAFPDKSVAEALQRMSGITVTRFAASGDTTHFSAEPSGVVIRGLPQVRSEFNGRDSFNANSSRGLSFADVSPELMAGVDTYKNATADMIEGGIAGTVNLRTHVPFDSEGFVAAFSGEVGYGDLSEEAKPSGSALISNRWDTGIGEIGLMVNAAYSSVTTESQGLQLNRFFQVQNGGNTNWIPGGVDIRDNTYDRTRTGGSMAVQWKNPAENLTATLQYNRSEYKNEWEEYSLNAGIGNSQTAQDLVLTNPFVFPAVGSGGFEFDSNGVFTSGVLNDSVSSWAGPVNAQLDHPNGNGTGATTGSMNWFCYTWSGAASCPATRGIGLGADTRFSTSTNLTEDTSLNLRWDVNDRLGLNFDAQVVDASVVNFDNSMNSKSATDLYLELHGGGKPSFEFRLPTGFGMTAGGFSDPRNYYHEWTMEHTENSSGKERLIVSTPTSSSATATAGSTGCASVFVARSAIRTSTGPRTTGARCNRSGACSPRKRSSKPKAVGPTRTRRTTWARTCSAAVYSPAVCSSTRTSTWSRTTRRPSTSSRATATPGSRWARARIAWVEWASTARSSGRRFRKTSTRHTSC